jgi:hypothetical protein
MSLPIEKVPGWESLAPALRKRFLDADLPASFLKLDDSVNFVVGPDLAEVEVPRLGRLLRFGHGDNAYGGEFGLNLETGTVHLLMPDNPPAFVNSSLELFARAMRLVTQFEREITTGDAEDREAAVEQIREGIERLDEPAMRTDTYWDAISYDFAAGNYSDNADF